MLSLLLGLLLAQDTNSDSAAFGEIFGIQSEYCAGLTPGQLPTSEQLEACWGGLAEQFVAAGSDIDPQIMSNDTRQCILRVAPHVEATFESLREAAVFIVEFTCADWLLGDYTRQIAALSQAEQGDQVETPAPNARNLTGNPSYRTAALAADERPAAVMDFIGQTLLELRINRIQTERQEEN